MNILNKIQRKWMKLHLQPIGVYCLHHVCASFDADSMNECDWMPVDEFKRRVLEMRQEGVEFISLADAYQHMCKDLIRRKRYAVLTFDDGYASLKEILPWLEEQNIPATLFINGKYLDGKSYRKNSKEKYLTKEELFEMTSHMVEIGLHGWEHIRSTEQTEQEFEKSVKMNINELDIHPRYVPFHAYTYGDHNTITDDILNEHKLIPVYIDGLNNYNELSVIHREMLK